MTDNDYLEKNTAGNLIGYAQLYLFKWGVESKSIEEMDIEAYSKLVKLDARLKIAASKQLSFCLVFAPRSDFITVSI